MLRILSRVSNVVAHSHATSSSAGRAFSGLKDVKVNTVKNSTSSEQKPKPASGDKCGTDDKKADDDDLEELEEMFIQGPAGMEWGGPTRGGRRPEPTRFGDWERKGRATDFR